MELVQGQTLEEEVREHGPLPAPEVSGWRLNYAARLPQFTLQACCIATSRRRM
jgi:hypothetical protein